MACSICTLQDEVCKNCYTGFYESFKCIFKLSVCCFVIKVGLFWFPLILLKLSCCDFQLGTSNSRIKLRLRETKTGSREKKCFPKFFTFSATTFSVRPFSTILFKVFSLLWACRASLALP